MSALAADSNRQRKSPGSVDWPVVASDIIYLGAMCMRDTSGNLLPAADTASCVFAGIAQEHADNATGAAGAVRCKVDAEELFLAAGTGFAAGDEGKAVYATDDNTVTLTANSVRVGIIRTVVSSTQVWVDPRTAVGPVAGILTDGSTNARFASLASSTLVSAPSLTRTDARFASLASSTLVSAPSLVRTDGLFTSLASVDVASAITSASFSATPTSAELAALAALCGSVASVTLAAVTEAELVGDDVTALRASLAADIAAVSSALVEAELLGDLARATVAQMRAVGLLAA